MTAPAGYGKTTLLVSWKNNLRYERSKQPLICWLNLDKQDNDEDIFFSYFLFAFYNNPSIPVEMKEIAIKKFGGCNSFNSQHLVYFINDVSKLNQEIILILDNFHFITNDTIQQSFKFLTENMPSNMHIFLSGREMPKIQLAREKMYGNILEINERELNFTYEETEKFYTYMHKSNYSKTQIKEIYRQTQGWPAGVQLMILSIYDRKDRGNQDLNIEKRLAFLENKNNVLYDFLMEEIFCSLSKEYKKFLICTSLPEYFTIPQCRFILDMPDTELYIKKLKEKRLFSCYTNDYSTCFQYHPMFREFLLEQFSLQDELLKLELYKKLILWYEKEEQWNEAITYAIKCKEFKKAISLIEKLSVNFGCRGETHILDRWNKLLPSNYIMNNPRLLLNSAWVAVSKGNRKKLQIYLNKLSLMQLSSEMKREITALVSSNISPFDDNLNSILQDCKEAVKDLTEDSFISELLYFNIGTIYLFKGNLIDSRLYFEKCFTSSLKTGRAYLAIISNQAITRYYMQQEQFKEVEWVTKLL